MAWVYLILAGALEIAWAVSLKLAVKHPRYWPMLLAFMLSIGSFLLLMKAMKELSLGTSYLVWTGIGAFGAATCGMLFFQESTDPRRILFAILVVIGIAGLKWLE